MINEIIKEWNKLKQELKNNIIETKENNKEKQDIYNIMLNMLENTKVKKRSK